MTLPPFDLYRARTVEEAGQLLATTGGRPLAGATDLIPMMRAGKKRPQALIDLSLLEEWRYIRQEGGIIHIGPITTHAQIEASEAIRRGANLLAQAAESIGGPQIRQRGTVGGNIATASPAADMVPPLLVLGAEVTLVSVRGERRLPLEEILLGPGETAIEEDELIGEVAFPALDHQRGLFLKLGKRRAMAISVVTVAAVVRLEEGRIKEARLALGAVAPTVIRAREAEEALLGRPLEEGAIAEAASLAASAARPISDIRASAEYRREMVKVLVRRALSQMAEGAR